MGTLTMVRHGQAKAFQENPDCLTETGEAQARALASYWLSLKIRFDQAYAGTLVRHLQTAGIVEGSYVGAEVPFPGIRTLDGLNEYPAEKLLEKFVPWMEERSDSFRELVGAHRKSAPGAERYRRFQHMFEAVMKAWVDGRLPSGEIESWNEFQERVWNSVLRIIGESKAGARIVVFSSGGPIGLTVQRVLRAPETMAIELNWRIRNGSLSDFVFSGERITLDAFNAIPHLKDPSLWTYR